MGGAPMEPVEMQFSAFTVVFFAGMTLGLLYDLYRLFRQGLRLAGVLDWLFDALFWIIATPSLMFLIFFSNWGEMRIYILLATALGVFFYFKVLSDTMRGLLRLIIKGIAGFIRGIFRLLKKALVTPVLWFWDSGAGALDRLRERREKSAS
jgi:spore cortex biosynthesis protein YabQ